MSKYVSCLKQINFFPIFSLITILTLNSATAVKEDPFNPSDEKRNLQKTSHENKPYEVILEVDEKLEASKLEWCARNGNVQAQSRLGFLLAVKGNREEAIDLLEKAADQKDAAAQYNLCVLHSEKETDIEKIKESVEQAAEKPENTFAHSTLGDLLYDVEDNPTKANDHYEKAAEKGDVHAQYKLGMLDYHKNGVDGQAIKWLTKAAEKNHFDAQALLGFIHLDQNKFEEAENWLSKAAERTDCPEGPISLGEIRVGAGTACIHQGLFLASKDETAEAMIAVALAKLAERGETEKVQDTLDQLRKHMNEKIEKARAKFNKGIKLFKVEAEKGDSSSQLVLGSLLINSNDFSEEGERWLSRASKSTNDAISNRSYNKLGSFYCKKIEEMKASQTKAVDSAIPDIQATIKDNPKLVSLYREKAIDSYSQAARKGNAKAQFKLGEILAQDEDEGKKREAENHFEESANKGYLLAQRKWAELLRKRGEDKEAEKWEIKIKGNTKNLHKPGNSFEHTLKFKNSEHHKIKIKKEDKKTVFVLSVDGGGIRGIIPAVILRELEEKLNILRKKEGFRGYTHLAENFDLMAGTSTGGIIVLGLNVKDSEGRPRNKAQTLVSLYEDNGEKIFPPIPWYKWWFWKFQSIFTYKYNPAPLEEVLQKYFGDSTLENTYTDVLIPAYNMGRNAPFLFETTEARENPRHNFLLKDVARATSAAPTYFSLPRVESVAGKEGVFADGGVWANDPTFEAIQKAMKDYPHAENYFVMSIGTGKPPKKLFAGGLGSGGELDFVRETEGFLLKAMEQARELHLKHLVKDKRITFRPFQTVVGEAQARMDKADKSGISDLINIAEDYLKEEEAEKMISSIAAELHKTHQENRLLSYRSIIRKRGYIEPPKVPLTNLLRYRVSNDPYWTAAAIGTCGAVAGAGLYIGFRKTVGFERFKSAIPSWFRRSPAYKPSPWSNWFKNK